MVKAWHLLRVLSSTCDLVGGEVGALIARDIIFILDQLDAGVLLW